MNPWLVALMVFASIYGGAMLGFVLRRRIPPDHLDSESREVLKVATGLIATMSALVLGLLVASAKSSYDQQKDELMRVCADVAVLDRALAHYGPQAAEARRNLRGNVEGAFGQLWNHASEPPSEAGESLYETVQGLEANTEKERALKGAIIQITVGLGKTRWLLRAQSGQAVLTPLLVVVVFWLTTIFVTFGLYARPNPVVRTALVVCALSAASAIFLILEMDHPFHGLIRISDAPLRDVVSRLGK